MSTLNEKYKQQLAQQEAVPEEATDEQAELVQVILASSSPRRHELLNEAGITHLVHGCEVDETLEEDLRQDPLEAAKKLAERKARATVEELLDQGFQGLGFVIGADTMVVKGSRIYGKPQDEQDAFETLRELAGEKHQVITGVSCWFILATNPEDISVGMRSFTESSFVVFKKLSDQEIWDYIATGEPFDKAGSYGIQGKGEVLVERLEGDLDCVIGLPVQALLRRFPELAEVQDRSQEA